MAYYKTKYGQIVDGNNQLIPMDESSPLYVEYVAYLRADGTIYPTDYVFPEDLEHEQKEATKLRYENYKLDGWNAYQDFRAELVRKIDAGLLTESEAFIIENYLSVGYDKISHNGDWKTAQYKLSLLSLPSQYQFVNEYLTKAKKIISDYIIENYPVR